MEIGPELSGATAKRVLHRMTDDVAADYASLIRPTIPYKNQFAGLHVGGLHWRSTANLCFTHKQASAKFAYVPL
jgi:hypothetical protein